MLRLDVVSVFPTFLEPLRLSLMGKAIEDGLLSLTVHDLRSHTRDKHQTVDDSPYGGGPGMVMKPEPWGEALDELVTAETILVIPTPSGRPFTQAMAQELSSAQHIVFACGRYEGIDSRVAQHYQTKIRVEEVSIGDYVLAGGEVAVLVMVETIPLPRDRWKTYLRDQFLLDHRFGATWKFRKFSPQVIMRKLLLGNMNRPKRALHRTVQT